MSVKKKEGKFLPKVIDYAKRKQEIIDCTIRLLIENGYHNTNLKGIAQELGLGRTTIYQYFENKDDIINYAIRNAFEVLEARCEEIIKNNDMTIIEKIKAIVLALATDNQNEKSVSAFLINLWIIFKMENTVIKEKIKAHFRKVEKIICRLLEEGMDLKEIKQLNAESVSRTIYMLIQSFIINAEIYHNTSLDEHIKNINVFIESLQV